MNNGTTVAAGQPAAKQTTAKQATKRVAKQPAAEQTAAKRAAKQPAAVQVADEPALQQDAIFEKLLKTNLVVNKGASTVDDYKEFAKMLNAGRPRNNDLRTRASAIREMCRIHPALVEALVDNRHYDDLLLVDPRRYIALLGLEKKVFINWSTKRKRYNVAPFKERASTPEANNCIGKAPCGECENIVA